MDPSSDRERARAIVLRHGRETVVFQGLGEEFRYWFDPELEACVAYVDTQSAWVAAGGPACAVEHRPVLAEKFVVAARAAGRGACFFCVDHPTELGTAFAALRLGDAVPPPRTSTHRALTPVARGPAIRPEVDRGRRCVY